jgi:uncharacterized RmlC-like cupin family protein
MERLHHVPAGACTGGTAQTSGRTRFAAISGDAVGARALRKGRTHVAPRASSGPHHHGHSETGIYVVSGTPAFVYREDGREVHLRTRPGDFVYVPAHVPHIESNEHSDEEAVVVIARTTQEAIVVNLASLEGRPAAG